MESWLKSVTAPIACSNSLCCIVSVLYSMLGLPLHVLVLYEWAKLWLSLLDAIRRQRLPVWMRKRSFSDKSDFDQVNLYFSPKCHFLLFRTLYVLLFQNLQKVQLQPSTTRTIYTILFVYFLLSCMVCKYAVPSFSFLECIHYVLFTLNTTGTGDRLPAEPAVALGWLFDFIRRTLIP